MAAISQARKQVYLAQADRILATSNQLCRDQILSDEEGLNIIYAESPGKYRGSLLGRIPSFLVRFISNLALAIIQGTIGLICCCKNIHSKLYFKISLLNLKHIPLEIGYILSAALCYRSGQGLKAYREIRQANIEETERLFALHRPG